MNVIDIAILVIIGISMVVGMYRGFVATVLHTGGTIISMVLSFIVSPKLANLIQGNTSLRETLGGYADVSSRLGDMDTAMVAVQDLVRQGTDRITEVVAKVKLPDSIARLLESNISQQVFGSAEQVQQYVAQTIVNACVNILCYVVAWAVIALVISLVIRLIKAVFSFPVLKQCDSLAGGAFGILRGVLIVFVVMAALPLVQTLLNMDMINTLVEESALASWFTGGSMITAIMNGHL